MQSFCAFIISLVSTTNSEKGGQHILVGCQVLYRESLNKIFTYHLNHPDHFSVLIFRYSKDLICWLVNLETNDYRILEMDLGRVSYPC